MNRHQVLTGAANAGDHCYAIGSVEGITFTAYAAGTDIVVLASDFQRVQIIPGAIYGNVEVTCIDCCTDAGKIAASYGNKVHIFEPTPLLHHDTTHKLDYQWYHTGTLEADCQVLAMSFNQEGSCLLTAGEHLQMWACPELGAETIHEMEGHQDEAGVEFFIEDHNTHQPEEAGLEWICVWQCRPATPVYHVKFSPDGLLFATVGKVDRMIKIWYENKRVDLPLMRTDSVSPKKDELHYSFIYVAHPRAVTGFSWRNTSKYMPRGSVAHMLVTSCRDNICRLWIETVLPEDGLVDLQQLDPAAAHNPMFHTHRHKKRFLQRLHHIRHLMHKRKRNSASGPPTVGAGLSPLTHASQSVHDFHKFGVHPNSVAPGFHFHLAASINPDTDIPLMPTIGSGTNKTDLNFVVHWLNNKELHFTLQSEKILEEMTSVQRGGGASGEEGDSGTELSETATEMETEEQHSEPAKTHHPVAGMPSEPVIREALARKRRGIMKKSRSYLSTESERSTHSSAMSEVAIQEAKGDTGTDPLDHRIEKLLQDWHQGADMLFSLHPLDGSFLVWLVDWLDEPSPGSFRQAQVSFSSRIPAAIPIGDALTMSPRLLLYSNFGQMDLKAALLQESETYCSGSTEMKASTHYTANAMGQNSPGQMSNTLTPNVLMLSKHDNGSLNLWQISFAESSRFATVLSIAHASRACGHRFQTNSAACHPVLPLLLTTSHHNLVMQQSDTNKSMSPQASPQSFCSELILWRVDPVGPLSKSGGIMELARINSPQMSAFSTVAWLPTLLPSSTLGSFSNSPSALFVASDGDGLRVFQAVIDARTLLHDPNLVKKRKEMVSTRSSSDNSVGEGMAGQDVQMSSLQEAFKIISQQSTARPGCILELDNISDAKQDWQNIQMMHVFQEQLITGAGQRMESPSPPLEALVDLQSAATFEEHFYLVVVERLQQAKGSLLHMWRIVISSQASLVEDTAYYNPDVNYCQDEDEDTPLGTPYTSLNNDTQVTTVPRLHITTTKVCTQMLELPDSVHVLTATMAAGHLSSSTIYPACYAPYLLSTACSDGRVRFWHCKVVPPPGEDTLTDLGKRKYEWKEWEMMIPSEDTSAIKVAGKPIQVSCAYSGRVAVAYRMGGIKSHADDPGNKYINLCVSIYECESTGGSEWCLEDTIELKNISIPDPKVSIDLSLIYDNDNSQLMDGEPNQIIISPTLSTPAIVRTVPIPSPTTVRSVKQLLGDKDAASRSIHALQQRHLVQLDWVSTEDGSHILTVGVGPKILLYAAVSSEISAATTQSLRSEGSKSSKAQSRRGMLQKSKSMTVQTFVEEIRWMKVRSIELLTADGLPPLPMHCSWVRDGILVVGMDNEMHVYSQWRGPSDEPGTTGTMDSTDKLDTRTLTEQSLQKVSSSASLNLPSKSYKISQSMSSIKLDASISNLSLLAAVDKKGAGPPRQKGGSKDLSSSDSVMSGLHFIQDTGLFEAARLANPVLPQYHPKQLIELLNFGKIRRVKAILAHLVRCISGNDSQPGGIVISHETSQNRPRLASRTMSLAGVSSPPEGPTIPEDAQLDYIEISSIPPLPLYALLAADDSLETPSAQTGKGPGTNGNQDYSTLFSTESVEEELEDPFDTEDDFSTSPGAERSKRSPSHSAALQSGASSYVFGPAQSLLLTRHLTHTQLPGLSSLDQMYLLALADTVANTRQHFSEKQHQSNNVGGAAGAANDVISTDSIDDCGLRFMLAARHHVYLMNTLPMGQRAQLQIQGLNPTYFVWAFHSEAEEELLNVLPSVQKGSPVWAELRQFGVGWWVTNINTLRRCIEKVAKAAFQAKQDPMDAALFYLAMKKKNVVWGLFRSVDDTKMHTFFKNNFNEERWRKAALKNAFSLLGRQRFQHAAAFFLLAGAIRDAIEVCLHKLDDLQLAMVIARLYESEMEGGAMSPGLCRLLWEECLGCDMHGQNYRPSCVNPDPFIRSMAYWMMKDYSAALGTLLDTGLGVSRRIDPAQGDEVEEYASNPSVFNFYNYLRTHPLLVRQHLAATAADNSQTVLLSGFTHGTVSSDDTHAGDKNVTYVDCITPVERRLYFQTAHAHFKSGCPTLALEVLTKLPTVIDMENDITKSRSNDSMVTQDQITSGILDETVTHKSSDVDWSSSNHKDTASGLDWGQPASAGALDWSQPLSRFEDEKLDLSLDLDMEEDQDTKSDSEIESNDKLSQQQGTSKEGRDKEKSVEGEKADQNNGQADIMAQQLKFVACLKIMMEELSTLATGFEVDGGQLRFQLYIWLEKEVQVLKMLCDYGHESGHVVSSDRPADTDDTGGSAEPATSLTPAVPTELSAVSPPRPTLHEVILAEKLDFEAKLQRMARRKQWLKAHQQLLRTLLSYSVLHGAGGGGLASVRMELILLLQELQQEHQHQKQLLSPLPFPTSLPLLSASVASAKTVIADPIQYLKSSTQDILHTIVSMHTPPAAPNTLLPHVYVLRNLSAALSACIYQCLCDSDSFVVAISDNVDVGMEGFTSTNVVYKDSYLMAGAQRRRKTSSMSEDVPNSSPAKWPGVSSLRALLARGKDEDAPRVSILLAEALVAVYMSLLTHALATYDANILYRLVAHTFKEPVWHTLFGGGIKKLIPIKVCSTDVHIRVAQSKDELTKQRVKYNMRLLNQAGPPSPSMGNKLKEDKPTYKEKFLPPHVSMISYFMTKPYVSPDETGVDYDSAESLSSEEEDEEEEDDFSTTKITSKREGSLEEHLDPSSYSWSLLRYTIIHYIRQHLLTFLPQIGIELPELPVVSPLLQALLRTLLQWEEVALARLMLFNGPPDGYIPNCFKDLSIHTPIQQKYKAMMEPTNTPFLSHHYSSLPVKRLWHFLVRQPPLQDIFIRHIFKRRKIMPETENMRTEGVSAEEMNHVEPMKVIHKDQEAILSFCINQNLGSWTEQICKMQASTAFGSTTNGTLSSGSETDGPKKANLNCVAVGTQKEVIEMDITGILQPPVWLEDDTEYDIELIKEPGPNKLEPEDFLLVTTPSDRLMGGGVLSSGVPSMPPGASLLQSPQQMSMAQTGRGGSVMKGLSIPGITNPFLRDYVVDRSRRTMKRLTKRPVSEARRMGSHPQLPYYLTGSKDGSVRLWEWGHTQSIAVARQPGSFPKVTKVLFNAQGNKFGVSDVEGSVCLWQVGLGVNMNKPYMSLKCHNKSSNDFVFVGSSSLLATSGHSTESRNVCLWDTLLPQRSACVQAFHCHTDGAAALLYAPQHQVIVSAGKRGDISIFDVRQRQLRHTFQAHDGPIKCVALDPMEEFFVSGAADGDIKVWGLTVHNLVYSFPGEHSKSSIFRNMASGVTQLYVSPHSQLFSCGADGSMKVRQLPNKDALVKSYTNMSLSRF